jgi:hypothetical protein
MMNDGPHLELVKYRLHGKRGVKARQLNHGVGHLWQPPIPRLYDNSKALVICTQQSPEVRHQLHSSTVEICAFSRMHAFSRCHLHVMHFLDLTSVKQVTYTESCNPQEARRNIKNKMILKQTGLGTTMQQKIRSMDLQPRRSVVSWAESTLIC